MAHIAAHLNAEIKSGGDSRRGEGRGSYNLTATTVTTRMISAAIRVSHHNVSLTGQSHETSVHKSQLLKRKASRSGDRVEPASFRITDQPSARLNRQAKRAHRAHRATGTSLQLSFHYSILRTRAVNSNGCLIECERAAATQWLLKRSLGGISNSNNSVSAGGWVCI